MYALYNNCNISYLAFDDERFFLVTPCLRPLTETSWKRGSLIQIIANDSQENKRDQLSMDKLIGL